MTMIDKFINMLGEISITKTNRGLLKTAYHWFKAWRLKRQIIKYYNSKQSLEPNDIYNCIFMINHANDRSIDFLNSVFETYISNAGASFHYICKNREEDMLISLHKAVKDKAYSSIDIDSTTFSRTIHKSVKSIETEGYYGTTLVVTLEIVLQRIFSGDL